ncbi:replication initiation protein, partial [Campylobacter fetus]|uniref:replication initiation protein n=1 Tax=Campylobacter fetus TaxID=196 RepID=UPI00112FC064
LWKLKEQGDKEIRLDFAELKQLIGFEQRSELIRDSLKNIAKKIIQSVIEYSTDETTKFFTLFQVLEIPNKDDFYIRAKINEPFLYILNNFENGGFTMFELIEFSSLNSRYTQTLYRLLKQFRHTGKLWLEWSHFIEIMDIPSSYDMGSIERQILKPAI